MQFFRNPVKNPFTAHQRRNIQQRPVHRNKIYARWNLSNQPRWHTFQIMVRTSTGASNQDAFLFKPSQMGIYLPATEKRAADNKRVQQTIIKDGDNGSLNVTGPVIRHLENGRRGGNSLHDARSEHWWILFIISQFPTWSLPNLAVAGVYFETCTCLVFVLILLFNMILWISSPTKIW